LTGDPRTAQTDRNKEISASIIRRYRGDIALGNLEKATESFERYVVISSSDCSTVGLLKKVSLQSNTSGNMRQHEKEVRVHEFKAIEG
jgi:hypothetical protein